MIKKIKDIIVKINDIKKKHFLPFLLLTILVCACFPLVIEKFVYNLEPFYIKRFIFFLLFFESIGIIFFFEKKGFEFLYKYRYLIGIIIFILCVCLKINYSSAPILDDKIQASFNVTDGDFIIGKSRAIRTDDYVINITNVLSQYHNDFNLVNNDMMAKKLLMNLYPHVVNKNIISVLCTPSYVGLLFLPFENAYSFHKLFMWFVGFFSIFEMIMIISNKKKGLSLSLTLLILFSPVLLWFDTVSHSAYVALLFDILYLFLKSEKIWKKILYSVIFGWIGACYIMLVYPAWQIPFGFLFVVLAISLLYKYKEKLSFKDLLYALLAIIVVGCLVSPIIISSLEQYKLVTSTLYPGKRNVIGGGGLLHLFYYVGSIVFPIKEVGNACELSGFISLFPIPIILGIIQFIKNIRSKKKDMLLSLLLLLELIFLYFDIFGSKILSKIALLYMVPTERLSIVIHLVCILIMIRLLSHYSINSKRKHGIIIAGISFVSSLIVVYISRRILNNFTGYLYIGNLITACLVILYTVLFYLLIYNNKKMNILLCSLLGIISIFQFLTINPLVIGVDVYLDKPLSSEIAKISSKDEEGIWISTDSEYLQQYALASGAKVLNSVNYFPNYDYWKKIDKDKQYDEVYNRYGRIVISLTDDESSFELLAPDAFKLHLKYDDVCKLNIKYIVTETKYDKDYFDTIYDEGETFIYKTKCND